MAEDQLFGELPEQPKPQTDAAPAGLPRLREPQRDQIELRAVDIDSLIGEDHPARVIWCYVDGLELRELEDRIKARGERPGHPATSPRLLLALWLYATSDGVGSARALERLCESHDVYRWLCGGVMIPLEVGDTILGDNTSMCTFTSWPPLCFHTHSHGHLLHALTPPPSPCPHRCYPRSELLPLLLIAYVGQPAPTHEEAAHHLLALLHLLPGDQLVPLNVPVATLQSS